MESHRQIWAILRENARELKELRDSQKATDAQMKETDKRFGELSNRFGEMVEYMVLPNLAEKFDELGFVFTKANRSLIKDKEHGIFMELTLCWKTATRRWPSRSKPSPISMI
ncbi:MAG: hypothetical protein LBG43_01225 [Treponema sp.]|jgi:hypothetical protein|nr:hypothetical protein [Treponema sp.]